MAKKVSEDFLEEVTQEELEKKGAVGLEEDGFKEDFVEEEESSSLTGAKSTPEKVHFFSFFVSKLPVFFLVSLVTIVFLTLFTVGLPFTGVQSGTSTGAASTGVLGACSCEDVSKCTTGVSCTALDCSGYGWGAKQNWCEGSSNGWCTFADCPN